jgi:hypothetical protein
MYYAGEKMSDIQDQALFVMAINKSKTLTVYSYYHKKQINLAQSKHEIMLQYHHNKNYATITKPWLSTIKNGLL